MLDDIFEPSARRVAQMRKIAMKANIPLEIADMAANEPKLTAARFDEAVAVIADTLEGWSKGNIANPPHLNAEERMAGVRAALEAIPARGDFDPQSLYAIMGGAAIDARADRTRKEIENQPPHHVGSSMDGLKGFDMIGHSWEGGHGFVAKMSEGLAARLNPKEATAMGRAAAQFTIAEIAMQVCRNAGLKPFDHAEAIRMAAHTTSDFPLIIEGAISNDVARQIEQRMPDLVRASHEVAREDYRSGNALSLSASGMPQEVLEGGEIKFVTLEEKGEALPTVRDFASGFNISNQALQNDSTALRLMSGISGKMTEGAIERLRHVLLAPIQANSGNGQFMADGKTMFHLDHGNLAATGATITIDTVSAARLSMRKQKGLKGELRPVDPWALVVPAELETAAQQVVAQINAAKSDDVNPFSGTLEIIVEPGLTDDAAWYLIGNPTRYDGLAHAFLEGQRNPRVESRAGWNTLGMEFRLTWALDARFIETATWFRNPGA
ncbi:Mu-like prophage major head subunit gpT family protein [Seohaeicola sp. SP36]|uniref:phage major capsid protein n=1 Tax=unclassified Seohaeicola TaxID=2641111 RepID=UPI00237A2051|nr:MULTISPECIES: Mu-like prophage major head subunit gpT family protein [unclassified Seohaeicola]MDD9708768.1 Mu-like prophage major head subunit gpT family protein [Seohaeicola sp. 4SK31]MDD9734941.1 Mu-like prophage major head subunit gpT family protein [Seohaeicola sp. SP36]